MRHSRIKLKGKIGITFFLVGVIPAALIGGYSLIEGASSIEQQAFNQLEGIRAIKKAEVEHYFKARKNELQVLADSVPSLEESAFAKLLAVQELKSSHVQDQFKRFRSEMTVLTKSVQIAEGYYTAEEAFEDAEGKTGEGEWVTAADLVRPRVKSFVEDGGWKDILFINDAGDIIYTFSGENGLGKNIIDDELKDSSLGRAFASMSEQGFYDIVVGDFQPYAPANGAQAAFMVGRLRNADGYLAVQLPPEPINHIVQQRAGMGYSAETYLIGEIDGVSALRSDRVVKKGNPIGKKKSGDRNLYTGCFAG